jgi:thioredoxin-related protein
MNKILVIVIVLIIVLFVLSYKYEHFSSNEAIADTEVVKPILKLYSMNGCKFCDDFKPTWAKLKKMDILNSKVVFQELNENNQDGVSSFPTIRLCKDSSFTTYKGNRDINDIILFINNA